MGMTYKTAQVYTGSEWVDIAVAISEATQRTVGNITGTSYTLLETDAGKVLVFSNSSAIDLTIPAESVTNYAIGQTFVVIQKGTGTITIAGAVGVTIRSLSSKTKTNGQYSEARLIKIASNEWLLSGDLSS
jgi:uncharacterized protein YaiE (UPF0345 family)